jgi:DNA-binding NtrC family response regulator
MYIAVLTLNPFQESSGVEQPYCWTANMNATNDRKSRIAVIFSSSSQERDFLSNTVAEDGIKGICFEKETICFDNLNSIQPDVIIARTDDKSTAWRFVFAIHAQRLNTPLLIASDILKNELFGTSGFGVPVCCTAIKYRGNGFIRKINQTIDENQKAEAPAIKSLLVGETEPIKKIRLMVPYLATTTDPVLITGEQGTGKELLARLIHRRSDGESIIIKLNCAELHSEMIAKHKLFDKLKMNCDHPIPITILFDKIHLMQKETQAQVLPLFEQAPNLISTPDIGRTPPVRFIATSETDLEYLAQQGVFRKDLFYRLNVIPLYLPPLRDRKADISLLTDHLIIKKCIKLKKSTIIPSATTREALLLHNWRRNVDELTEMIHRIVRAGDEVNFFAKNPIPEFKKDSLEFIIKRLYIGALPDAFEIKSYLSALNNFSLKRIRDMFSSRTEKRIIQKALEITNWNRKKAAHLLNISYKSILDKIKIYGLS